MLAPYEYTDSLNQRQIWEPFLTGRERQEFDSHLRVRYYPWTSINLFLVHFFSCNSSTGSDRTRECVYEGEIRCVIINQADGKWNVTNISFGFSYSWHKTSLPSWECDLPQSCTVHRLLRPALHCNSGPWTVIRQSEESNQPAVTAVALAVTVHPV